MNCNVVLNTSKYHYAACVIKCTVRRLLLNKSAVTGNYAAKNKNVYQTSKGKIRVDCYRETINNRALQSDMK